MPNKYSSLRILDTIKRMAREHAILRHSIYLFENAIHPEERDEYLDQIMISVDENVRLLKSMRFKLEKFSKSM